MNKKEILAKAYEAGQNDEYVSQILNEQALEYFSGDVPHIEDDEERDKLEEEVIEAYNDGFMYTERKDLI